MSARPLHVCLIRPPAARTLQFTTTSPSLPLGLAYIAGALDGAGVPVHVIDAVAEAPARHTRYCAGYLMGLGLDEIAARIPPETTVVGLSVIFTHEWPAAVHLISLIKARRPDVRVVVGGEHVTSLPEFCLLTSRADVAVLGEGEETMVELVRAFERGAALHTVEGIAFRDGTGVAVTPRRRRQRDVDAIPRPAWHYFQVEGYTRLGLIHGIQKARVTIPLLATRGCPYQCTYCSAPNMWTPLWTPRDPVKVVDEIEYLVERFNARHFPFQDLTAIIQKDWIVAFCNELLRRKLDVSWELPGGTRMEAIDGEVAELLRRTNMIMMAYAPESGSETTRRLIKKKMHTERLFESIDAAVGAGLRVCLFMVVGFPHDTPELLAENIPFLADAAAHGATDASVAFYMALPGTELFESLYEAGKIRLDQTYFCHMLHEMSLAPSISYTERLSRQQLGLWKVRLTLHFYLARRRAARRARHAIGNLPGVGPREHRSRIGTGLRSAAEIVWNLARVRFKDRWMSEDDERALFAGWDGIYREIRRQKLAQGARVTAPTDTHELHRRNAVVALKKEHLTPRTVTLAGVAD